MRDLLSNKTIVIVIHEFVAGPGHQLLNYLLKNNAAEVMFIAHPLLYVKDTYKNSSYFSDYKKGKHVKKHTARHYKIPEQALYIKDVFYSVWWVLASRKGFNLYVGVDPLNAMAGIFLRELGFVDKVAYYSVDYFPTRFQNKIMNRIYHSIDKFCVRFSDETWNISKTMVGARAKYNNMNPTIYDRQVTVPVGIWFHEAHRKSFQKIDKKRFMFVGNLEGYMGMDLVLRSFPKIRKKIPGANLEIVGGGETLDELKKLAKELNITKSVKFYGWVADRKKVEELLSHGAIGLAPFNTKILDDKIKNADPAKVKDYMQLGMPVIVTDAVHYYKDIEKAGAGIKINYSEDELVNAAVKIMSNEDRLKEYRENALRFVEQFDYENVFGPTLTRILEKK